MEEKMKKILFALLPLAAVTSASAVQFEFARFVNGSHQKISAGSGFEVKTSEKRNGILTEHHLKLANRGKETLLLRIRAKADAGKAGGGYWDGNSYTRKAEKSITPVLDRHVFPLTSYTDNGKISMLGLAPSMVVSRFERSLKVKDGKAELVFDLFRVLYPGEKLDDIFVSAEFPGVSYVEAVENYHLTYPSWFRPAPGVDPRIYGTGGYLSSDSKLRDYQYGECRRTGFDWEWYYNSYQRSGDYYPSPEFWDDKLGYKEEKSHAKCNVPGTIADWERNHKIRTAAGDKTSALFYYYMSQYCNTDLLKHFSDSLWKDANGKPGYRVKGWADEFWAEYVWSGQSGSFGKKTRSDLAKLWKNLTIAGFALDCAIGTTPYYGDLIKSEPFRAYDKNGKIFVLEGVALAYNMNYTRNLPLRPDGRRAGSIVNAPYNYLSIFYSDGEMHEASAWERIDLPVPHRLMLGRKPWVLWRGFVLAPFLDWKKLKPEEVNTAISGAVDYLTLFSLRMGASPSKMFMRGYPDMLEVKPLITRLNRAGWHASPYVWVKGMAGADDPWDGSLPMWVSRYGEGDESFAVVSNPRRKSAKGTLVIQGGKFGSPGAVYADLTGKVTVNTVKGADTEIDFELPPFGYLVLKKVSGGKSGVVKAQLPPEKAEFAYLPADDSWVETLPLSSEKQGALAAIAGKADELKELDYLVTELSVYAAFHRGRRRVPMPRLWHLVGTFKDRFRFPVVEKSSAKTTFALGKSARKEYFPGVNETDKIVYRQENGRHYVGFFPGKKSEAELLKSFLFRLDKAYPYIAATMSDWPGKVKAADKAFRKNQPTLADAMVHPAYAVRFALKADEIAVARRDGKLFLRTRFSDTHDLVTELITGSNGQFEFGSSRKIPAGLAVTSDAMLDGDLVYAAIDEGAPLKTTYGNIGANHGSMGTLVITVPDHGFTLADVGKSQLKAGARTYYILKIMDKDTLMVISENIGRNGIGFFDRSSLKTAFTCSGKEYKVTKIIHNQLRPNCRIKKQQFRLDGKELPEGEFIKRGKKLTCDESYEMVSLAGVAEFMLKNPGREIALADPAIPSSVEINNLYTFTPDGTMYLDQKCRLTENTALREQGLLQTQIIYAPGRNPFKEYFIPKTLPFEQDKVKYDFACGVDTTGKLPRIFFTMDRVADRNNLPDRFIQIAGNTYPKTGKVRETGLVIGYSLRYGNSRPELRKNTIQNHPVWINVTQKSYPYIHQSTGGVVIKKGTVVELSGYRKLFAPEKYGKAAPASYTVMEKGKELLYLHFAEKGTVKVPEKFTKAVEKSPDASFAGNTASGAAGAWLVLE